MVVVDIFKNKQQSYGEMMDKWFYPWYPEEEDWTPGQSNLNQEWQNKTLQHLAGMAEACVDDMQAIWGIELDFSLESVKFMDQWITPSWRHFLQNGSDPGQFSNRFLVVTCELGAYLLQVILRNYGGQVVTRAPYWDSSILVDDEEIFIFSAVIQRFSEGINQPEGLFAFMQQVVNKF